MRSRNTTDCRGAGVDGGQGNCAPISLRREGVAHIWVEGHATRATAIGTTDRYNIPGWLVSPAGSAISGAMDGAGNAEVWAVFTTIRRLVRMVSRRWMESTLAVTGKGIVQW